MKRRINLGRTAPEQEQNKDRADHVTSPEAPSGRANRRLAAVLHADVAGFSRLMAMDEVGMQDRLIFWRGLIYHELARHGGRVVGTAGMRFWRSSTAS